MFSNVHCSYGPTMLGRVITYTQAAVVTDTIATVVATWLRLATYLGVTFLKIHSSSDAARKMATPDTSAVTSNKTISGSSMNPGKRRRLGTA